ncbi:MAG: DUF882 domain-containing protein [Gammaproteobacteria bacterium]|nr:DUF882 domain-containing protein [Gammaproteobacteria bacterium]
MRAPVSSDPQPPGTRRAFLHSVMAIGAWAGMAAMAPRWVRAAPVRLLSFSHTHTGESLTIPYRGGACYEAGCLEAVNHLLRDFRTGEVHRIDPGLLDILCALQDQARSDEPFQVISGYRSPRTNARLRAGSAASGVAERSLHRVGQAIDVRLGGVRTHRLAELARGLQRGGVGYYKSSDFVHVDTGRVRHW